MSRYYSQLAAAFVRGRLGRPDLGGNALIALGREQGLRLHRFKRNDLPRVHKVIGILKGLRPDGLLDVGTGRGTFLWPLLDAMPELPVTAIDLAFHRVRDLATARAGGALTLRPACHSALALGFADGAFDVVTALEVLEHLASPRVAARELLRVARRFVVASVPSKPDDNPQHVQFFHPDAFAALFLDAGARAVDVDHVLNHRIAVVKVPPQEPAPGARLLGPAPP